MTFPTKRFLVESARSVWHASTDNDWLKRFREQSPKRCFHELPWFLKTNLKLTGPLVDTVLNFEFGTAVTILRRDFLTILGIAGRSDIRMGTIQSEDGDIVENFVTVVSRRRPVLRGDEILTARFCKDCGTFVYQANRPWYLVSPTQPMYPVEFPDGLAGTLIVSQEIRDKIVAMKFKKLRISELPVVDSPTDGFPKNLSKVTSDLLRTLRKTLDLPK